MTTTKGAPRPDHIAELTRGTRLPLAPIREEHLSIILETITCAWQELSASSAPTLQCGDEAEVSALLDPRLNHFCQSQPLWKDLVHSVHRGRESVNHDGSKLELRPDLSFIFFVEIAISRWLSNARLSTIQIAKPSPSTAITESLALFVATMHGPVERLSCWRTFAMVQPLYHGLFLTLQKVRRLILTRC